MTNWAYAKLDWIEVITVRIVGKVIEVEHQSVAMDDLSTWSIHFILWNIWVWRMKGDSITNLAKSVENQKIKEALDYKGLRAKFGDF